MERASDKVSPRQDDALKHDTEGLIRGGHATHAQEWKGSEPAGEDQPEAELDPDRSGGAGHPLEMSAAEVEARSELATYIGRADYPLDKGDLLDLVRERQAPDRVVAALKALPGRRKFDNLQDVWSTIGGHAEQRHADA